MTWRVLTGLGVLLAVGGCARDNPLFGSTAGQSGGADGDATGDDDDDDTTSGPIDPDSGDSTAAGMSATTTGPGDGPNDSICGNGRVEGDEECDDDREFCVNCTELGRIVWLTEYKQGGSFQDRFQAVALAGGRVAAVGETRTEGDPAATGVVVLVDPETGVLLHDATILDGTPEGTPYFGSELHDLAVVGDELYAAGAVDLTVGTGGYTSAVVVYDITRDPVLQGAYQAFAGNIARALAHDDGVLGVGLANWTLGAYGAGVVATDGMNPEYWLSVPMAAHNTAAMAVLGDQLIAGGMSEGRPFIATTQGSNPPLHWALDGVEFDGEFQGLLQLGGDVVASGYAGVNARDPWIGRFQSDGSYVWAWVGEGGGPAEEFETATLDGAGNVVVIGHVGDPTHGIVMVFEPDGTRRLTRVYDELPEGTRFRDVVYAPGRRALIIVGEAPPNDGTLVDALIMRVSWKP